MTQFGLFGKLRAHSGQRDALVDVLLEAADALGRNAHCLLYAVHVASDEPDCVYVTELWTDEEAHGASLQDELIRLIVQRGLPLVAEMAQQVRLIPVGGKGPF